MPSDREGETLRAKQAFQRDPRVQPEDIRCPECQALPDVCCARRGRRTGPHMARQRLAAEKTASLRDWLREHGAVWRDAPLGLSEIAVLRQQLRTKGGPK